MPKDYRPIGLCNVVYKIISKILANKLKGLLSGINDESCSAFVQGRMIFDNIMVDHETIHAMKSRKSGKIGWLAAKLDMSKAYDMIEWDYLKRVMRKMGFSHRWIDLMMSCVRTITYSVVINSKQCGNIVPSRGLRKRDLLSPYLFLLCAEGLVSLMKRAVQEGLIQGIAAGKGGPRVSKLFFC